MNKRIIWSTASEQDVGMILEYLQSNWNRKTALKFINRIDNTTKLALDNPQLFPVINKRLSIRKIVLTKQNSLFYREKNQNIEIIRVFDSRQDPKKSTF